MLVNEYLSASAQVLETKTAVADEHHRLTYAEYEQQSNRLAHALQSRGVRPGDRVGIVLGNCVEGAVALFAVLKAGAAFVMINPATKPDKVCLMLNDCAASAVITEAHRRDEGAAIAGTVPSVHCVVLRGQGPAPAPASGLACLRIDELGDFPATPPPAHGIDTSMAGILYTSGSTGRPKGVVVSHLNMITVVNSVTSYLENVPDDVILNVLPLSFGYGLYQAVMCAKLGATLVLEPSFAYPFRVIERMAAEGVTGFPGVPTMFAVLQQMGEMDPAKLDNVRYVTNAAAALPPAHVKGIRGLFRNARIFSMYGVTECARVSYMPPEELDGRPTSVGKGMPNQEVAVVDEAGEPVPPNTVGELVVRGSHVMQGYWGLPEQTSRALRPGRYPWEKQLYTGDLFTMDEQGYLYFVSRKDDIIKTRGEKVSPKEVERVLYELPGIMEAAVVGVPDEVFGQAIKAVVVLTDTGSLTEKDIIKHCARRLENFMVPQIVEFRDSLPKTLSGKIRAASLVESSPEDGVAKVHPAPKRGPKICRMCVLPETFPGIHFDETGLCNLCRTRKKSGDYKDRKQQLMLDFREIARTARKKDGYHCLLAYSGGKDSTYTLWLLRRFYNLRVLAVTFDHGFTSPQSFANIRKVVEGVEADSLVIKPQFDLLRRLFSGSMEKGVFPPKALERASRCCNACITLVKNIILRTALEKDIPIVAYGWTPGQAPISAALFKMNAAMVRQMHDSRSAPLFSLVGKDLAPYMLNESHFRANRNFPYSVNPMAFHPYREDDVVERIKELGWESPKDSDGNSTNCLLNGFAIRAHLNEFGYHPYAFEAAELVRMGALTREAALASLADLGTEQTARQVAARLGLPALSSQEAHLS